jgi:rhomboid protease GluP
MDHFAPTQPAIESFPPTRKSPMGRARVWLWFFIALFAAVIWVSRGRSGSAAWVVLAVLLVMGWLLDRYFRAQRHRDSAPVVLSVDALQSDNFAGKQKSFRWRDIDTVAVEPMANGNVLQLTLRADAPGLQPGRLARMRKPTLRLVYYSPAAQEALFEAVLERLRAAHPQTEVRNTLTQEREFREALRALAPRTWVTYALVAANVGVWLWMVLRGVDAMRPSAQLLFEWGGNAASAVQRGQWWRMLSATFLHSGAIHLLMNMVGLWSIGQLVERIYGRMPYLLIYLASGLAGSGLSLHFAAQQSVSVGASGAIFGIAGALLAAVFQHRASLPKVFGRQNLSGMGFFVLYSLVQGFTHSGIDNGAHVGGLLAGALLAYILPARFDLVHHARVIGQRSALALVAAGALVGALALTAPPAAVDVARQFAGVAAFERGVKRFEEASLLMQKLHAQRKAGALTELELDNKSRTELAPAYRVAMADLDQAWVPPQNPRYALLQEIRGLSGALIEALAMESVVHQDTGTVEPEDPARMAVLTKKMQDSAQRIQVLKEQLLASQAPKRK